MAITTWTDYKQWVAKVIESKRDFYYRGQSNANWPLQTSFHRASAKIPVDLLTYLDFILPEAHYHMCAWHNEITDLQNPAEFGAFLALLQHHGFPTPLLDWTLSPYIAAFFAFKNVDYHNPDCDHVKIYIFDYQLWTTSYTQPLNLRDTSQNYVSVLRPYSKFNSRIIHQRGSYTVTNVSNMGQYIQQCSASTGKSFLIEVLLSVKEKPAVMRELSLMGINQMTLFPGLDGICDAMTEQFFSPDKVGLTPNDIKVLSELLKKTPVPTDKQKNSSGSPLKQFGAPEK